MLNSMASITSSQFAVAVGIEFVLFIPVTFLATEYHQFLIFTGVNCFFFLHVFMGLLKSLERCILTCMMVKISTHMKMQTNNENFVR